jgi:hypothetical protein
MAIPRVIAGTELWALAPISVAVSAVMFDFLIRGQLVIRPKS